MLDAPFTANARALGSQQLDALQRITGVIGYIGRTSTALTGGTGPLYDSTLTPAAMLQGGSTQTWGSNLHYDNALSARTSTETRALNVAFFPRIHV